MCIRDRDLSEVAVDGSLHKAPCGGEGTGPNPTDRGKIGWKWSVATDTVGVPIGWVIDGANRNDSVLLEPTLQAVASRGLLADVETLHLPRSHTPSGCAGPSNAPTPGSPTSANCAATPTDLPPSASARLPSRSCQRLVKT